MATDVFSEYSEHQEQYESQLIMLGKQVTDRTKFNKPVIDRDNFVKNPPKTTHVQFKDSVENLKYREPSIVDNDDDHLLDTRMLKVTIKNKSIPETVEEKREKMKWIMSALLTYTTKAVRLRKLQNKIYQNTINRLLRFYFGTWKSKVKSTKEFNAKKIENYQLDELRKIQLFVDNLTVKQSELVKKRTQQKTELLYDVGNLRIANAKSLAISKLEAQKKIINQQRMKLVEQNRVIQDMKLKQFQHESINTENINIVKKITNTRRQFNRQNEISLSPSGFLMRTEARAAVRHEKARQLEIKRQKKLEEEKNKEDLMKRQQQEIQKQNQLDRQQQERMIQERIARTKSLAIEKTKIANEMADNFYRKYLVRRYIFRPFTELVKVYHSKLIKASRYFDRNSIKKVFNTWKTETKLQLTLKITMSTSVYHRNLLMKLFQQWIQYTHEQTRKFQVACDFYDLQLQEIFFNILKTMSLMARIRNISNENLAKAHNEKITYKKYFVRWRKYVKISDKIKESDVCREQWRQLVQTVIPDFAPKSRGVIIDY